jgi:hypothetical protein
MVFLSKAILINYNEVVVAFVFLNFYTAIVSYLKRSNRAGFLPSIRVNKGIG